MKNYEETINTVFDRIHEYEVGKKRRRNVISRTVTSLCCICFVALLGVGVWQGNVLSPDHTGQQGTDKTDGTNPTDIIPDAPVIWGNADNEAQEAGYAGWNGKTVTLSLHDVLTDDKTKNSLIAIGIGFGLDEEYVHNGKTLAEYGAEVDREDLYYGRLGELFKLGDWLKYGEALYETGAPNGEKWAKQLYDETVARIGEDLLNRYIVDGVFLKEELKSAMDEFDLDQRPCRIAYDKAVQAYYDFVANDTCKHLNKQNIRCEIRNGLVIFVTPDEFATLEIDNALFYSLALKDGQGADMTEPQITGFAIHTGRA